MMESQYTFTRYFSLKTCVSIIIVLCTSAATVVGQPVLTSSIANCGDDAKLTCTQSGFNAIDGRNWMKGSNTVSDTGNDVSGSGRYSEESTSNTFSLVISNATLADADNYTCDYNFQQSNPEPLPFECKPLKSGIMISRANHKMVISVSNIYPANTTVDSVSLAQTGSVKAVSGTQGSPTAYGDHFNFTWSSDDNVQDGTYNCTINITTISNTKIVKQVVFATDIPESYWNWIWRNWWIILIAVIVVIVVIILIGYFLCIDAERKKPKSASLIYMRRKAILDFQPYKGNGKGAQYFIKEVDENTRIEIANMIRKSDKKSNLCWNPIKCSKKTHTMSEEFYVDRKLIFKVCSGNWIRRKSLDSSRKGVLCQAPVVPTPGKPRSFGLRYNEDEIILNWEEATDDRNIAPIEKYHVSIEVEEVDEQKIKAESDSITLNIHNDGSNTVIPTDRKNWKKIEAVVAAPEMEYRVSTSGLGSKVSANVCAENKHGCGDYLDITKIKTKPAPGEQVPGKPRSIGLRYNDVEIVLTWEDALDDLKMAAIEKYHVSIEVDGHEQNDETDSTCLNDDSDTPIRKNPKNRWTIEAVVTAPEKVYRVPISGLGSKVYAKVCAENKHACGDYFDTKKNKIQPGGLAPDKPRNLDFSYKGDEIIFTWKDALADLDNIEKYHVSIEVDENEWKDETSTVHKESTRRNSRQVCPYTRSPKELKIWRKIEAVVAAPEKIYRVPTSGLGSTISINVCAENKHGCGDYLDIKNIDIKADLNEIS